MKRITLAVAFALAVVAVPAAAQQGPRISHGARPGGPFSAAVQVGNMYWLSGKIGVNAETREMTEGRVAAETHRIMASFGELLAELELDYSDIVRGVVYVKDIGSFSEFNAAWLEYFPSDPPSRVTVEVSNLVADAQIEISFIAVRTEGQ